MMTKRYFILMMAVLLSLTASAGKTFGEVKLKLIQRFGNEEIKAAAMFDDVAGTVTLGNGYNACISHFGEGILTIPGNYDDYKVVIGPMAFRFCSYLTEVWVEDGVETIGDYAFVGCSKLHTVKLPSTLTTIGSGAFSELPSLKLVYCNTTAAPAWQWNDVFSALGTKASMAAKAAQRFLYVPEGSLDNYKAYKFDGSETNVHETVGWADAFTRIYEMNDDPQTITSLDDLIAFRDAVNSGEPYKGSTNMSVTLTADIDMTTVSNWTPIGTGSKHPFTGTFNGNGHVIKNLKVDLSTTHNSYVGLFGYTSGAAIYNLHLMNPVVKGFYAGAVAGGAGEKSRITDVLVTSDVTYDASTVSPVKRGGGIVGACAETDIERCLFRGRVKGKDESICGGIVGWGGTSVTVIDCSADYAVTDEGKGEALGGIMGYSIQATLTRCMARNLFDNTTSTATIGWLVGMIENLSDMTTSHITNCAYWKQDNDIKMANTGGKATLEEADNQEYDSSTGMMGEATKPVLGDGWHYFTGQYQNFPIPATLVDMYMNNIVYVTTNDGLVFAPIGNPSDFTQYQVVDYTGTAESVTIPAEFNGKPVTVIGERTFYGAAIKAIDLGSVETIEESAFEECDALQTVVLPNSVEYVHARAFRGCDNLTSFTIGTGFEHHDDNFFADCPKLSTLQMSGWNKYGYRCEDNVLTHQSDYWFAYIIACAPGKTGDYTIPTYYQINKIEIFPDCFAGCTGLTSITFPAGMKYAVGKGAFRGATNLRYIDMHNIEGTIIRESETPTTYTADRHDPESPFYGLSQSTIVYLPGGHTAADGEPNIVIDGMANSLKLTDGWDFYPPMDITSEQGVSFDRTLQATRTEITQKTGNEITLKDENDEEVEVDELAVTGYTYTPCGYSVCLPYDLTLTAENARVLKPTAIDAPEGSSDNALRVTFTEVTDKKMEAYHPYYIVVSGEEEVSLSASGETSIPSAVTAVYTQAVGSSDFEFKGTTKAISNASLYDADKPVYILQSDGNWHKVAADTEDAYVPPFRAYFQAGEAKTANQLITVELSGDANGDGKVDVADIVEMVNAKNGQRSPKFNMGNADITGDGDITDADITEVTKIIMTKD